MGQILRLVSRILLVAGVILLFTAAVHPQWKVDGDGWASPRQNCGCRDVTSSCEYKGGDFGEFWDGAYCDVYNGARWLSVVNSVLIAWVTAATFAYGIQNPRSAWFISNVSFLAVFMVAGLAQILLMIKLPASSNGGGLTDLLYGFQVGVAGWVAGTIVFIVLAVLAVNKELYGTVKTHILVAMVQTGLLVAAVMFTAGFAHFKWKTILVREDRILIADFESMMADMHSNIGVGINDTTILANNAPLILEPNCCKGTEPNTDFELGLWYFCLCKNIKSECRWSNATILSGENCAVLETSQVFLWLTAWSAVLGVLWIAYDENGGITAPCIQMILVPVYGMITTISYAMLYDGDGMHGAGLIMYIVGFVSVTWGLFIHCIPRFIGTSKKGYAPV